MFLRGAFNALRPASAFLQGQATISEMGGTGHFSGTHPAVREQESCNPPGCERAASSSYFAFLKIYLLK